MKRIVAVVLILCLILSFTGCKDNEVLDVSSDDSSSSNTSSTISSFPNPQSEIKDNIPKGEARTALPNALAREYTLKPPTNTWSSVITLQTDGSFSGKYLEKRLEDFPEYPNGSFLICEFTGKFSNFIKIDQYTFAMQLTTLTPAYEPDEFWVEDGKLFETASPAGIENGNWFYIYCPGKPTSELEKFVTMWYHGNEVPDTLDMYGLYNPNERYTFYG